MTDRAERIPWATLIPGALAPNAFYGTGQGAVIPVIPVVAVHLSGSYAVAAFVASMLTIGQLVATLPSGWLVGRWGDRRSMLFAAGVYVIGGLCCLLAGNIYWLTAGVALIGMAAAIFTMARHAWITVAIPQAVRGRAMSTVAGINRLGLFVGPFVSAAVIAVSGQANLAFVVVIVTAVGLAAVVLLWTVPSDRHDAIRIANGDSESPAPGVFSTMRDRAGALLRIGLPASMLSTARTSRQIIVPLWGLGLGISEVHIALIAGVCAAIDFALFYTGGQIIDRFGRMWAALPCLLIFGATHVALGLTRHLSEPTVWFVGLAALMSAGSGLSAGVVGTMGSDLADQRNPAAFLSSWRLVTEAGPAGAPLLISAVTATISLTAAPVAMGLVAFASVGALARYVPRYFPQRPGPGR